jgi:hypothetical protein
MMFEEEIRFLRKMNKRQVNFLKICTKNPKLLISTYLLVGATNFKFPNDNFIGINGMERTSSLYKQRKSYCGGSKVSRQNLIFNSLLIKFK